MVVLPLDSPGSVAPRPSGPAASERSCALVNNMPDGAFEETERQFLGLLDSGSGRQTLEVRLFTMAGVRRGERTGRRIAELYSPLSELVDRPPDVLIVTGANPVEEVLEREPYWDELVRLLSWASEHVDAVLLSCLSAHAALLAFDGLRRVPLAAKCTGVFAQRTDPSHRLSAGLGRSVVLPHSRLNDVPVTDMVAAGWDIPVISDRVGWSVATKRVERAEMVLVQAHPEYGPTSLLREYHRDARRYVIGERDQLPVLPHRCAARRDQARLEELQERITSGERDPALVGAFPFRAVEDRAPWPWRAAATKLYANWLAALPARA
jgi:homoserine O-succinyltransferase